MNIDLIHCLVGFGRNIIDLINNGYRLQYCHHPLEEVSVGIIIIRGEK